MVAADGRKRCPGCEEFLDRDEFRRNRNKPDGLDSYCKTCRSHQELDRKERRAPAPPAPGGVPTAIAMQAVADDAHIARLLHLTRKGALSMEAACDAVNCSPSALRALVARAAEAGFTIAIDGSAIGRRPPEEDETVRVVAPAVTGIHRVAVASDLHFGSKHCGRAELRDFLEKCRARGVTRVLGPGDNLDGSYKHSMWDRSHHGFEAQAEDFHGVWKDFPDLELDFIDGNHDETLSDDAGMVCGRMLVDYMAARGCHNLRFHGQRAAMLSVGGVKVHLWHPRGSGSYAVSYKLQKKVEAYAPGQKPDVLLTGHYHQFCYTRLRGIHAFLCPTFQKPGGPFGNSLVGEPAVGGLILGWELTADRTVRSFHFENVSYYAGECQRDAV